MRCTIDVYKRQAPGFGDRRKAMLQDIATLTGGTASAFFNTLTLMANVSMTLPYLFLALAFPFFKARQDLDRPFVIFKTHM